MLQFWQTIGIRGEMNARIAWERMDCLKRVPNLVPLLFSLNCISEMFPFWIGSFRFVYWKSQCGQHDGRNNKSRKDFIDVLMTSVIWSQKSVFQLVLNLGIWKILTSSSWVLRKTHMSSSLSKKNKNIKPSVHQNVASQSFLFL